MMKHAPDERAATGPNPRELPSVDATSRTSVAVVAIDRHGRKAFIDAARAVLAEARGGAKLATDADSIAAVALARLDARNAPRLKPVFNLTGTVLHTNLGRARLAEEAIAAATIAMREAVALEFDLDGARRGERDEITRDLLRELSGAEDATIVNNNAAAILLILNTLAKGRGAIVSRGELIEIGGAFRLPEIMNRAGAKLVEVGTTNRTHFRDYENAIDDRTGLLLKVHTSNYRVEGFTAEVSATDLAVLARNRRVPLVNDLGSGTLVDLSIYGLPREPTVSNSIAEGADLVAFSGDKLLGGPQAGFIVGNRDLISRINRNPMKRALRVDKIRLAAIEATLRLYRDPDRLASRLPTLRHLSRPLAEIDALARRVASMIAARLGAEFSVDVVACASQVGSGALPLETIPSAGVAIRARGGRALARLTSAFRQLPMPVIGYVRDKALIFDLRCLDDEGAFLSNLAKLDIAAAARATSPP